MLALVSQNIQFLYTLFIVLSILIDTIYIDYFQIYTTTHLFSKSQSPLWSFNKSKILGGISVSDLNRDLFLIVPLNRGRSWEVWYEEKENAPIILAFPLKHSGGALSPLHDLFPLTEVTL